MSEEMTTNDDLDVVNSADANENEGETQSTTANTLTNEEKPTIGNHVYVKQFNLLHKTLTDVIYKHLMSLDFSFMLFSLGIMAGGLFGFELSILGFACGMNLLLRKHYINTKRFHAALCAFLFVNAYMEKWPYYTLGIAELSSLLIYYETNRTFNAVRAATFVLSMNTFISNSYVNAATICIVTWYEVVQQNLVH